MSTRDQLLGLAVLGILAVGVALWAFKTALRNSIDEMESDLDAIKQRNER